MRVDSFAVCSGAADGRMEAAGEWKPRRDGEFRGLRRGEGVRRWWLVLSLACDDVGDRGVEVWREVGDALGQGWVGFVPVPVLCQQVEAYMVVTVLVTR